MPLIHSRSRKAVSENIKTEMEHGKPQKQAIAIAMNVKRRSKKASGGMIKDEQASSESRPMPDQRARDASQVRTNSADASPRKSDSFKTGENTSYQAQKGMRTTPIKHPKMVPQSVYSTRLRDEEDSLESLASPSAPSTQPAEWRDEEGPDRQGPRVPDMASQHNNKRKPYAEGGSVSGSSDEDAAMHADLHDNVHMEYGSGPEEDRLEHPHEPTDDSETSPAEDEFMAGHFAEGGMPGEDEESMEHDASVASAVMARRKRMARGGEIMEDQEEPLSHDSIYTHEDEDQADLARNAEEDANEEDQLSFNALRKENYSESDALHDQPEDSNEDSPEHEPMDEHDDSLVGRIRSKMKARSAITRGGEGR